MSEFSGGDGRLTRQLEVALSQFFYQSCQEKGLELLLSQCEFYITAREKMSTLVINCPSVMLCWSILSSIGAIASVLEELGVRKVRLCPPVAEGTPLELRVDEMDIILGLE